MKKLITAILVSASLSAFACGGYGDLYPKWSIGVIGYGNMYLPNNGMNSFFLPGVQFTHRSNSGLWNHRVAVEHIRRNYSAPDFPPGGADMMHIEGFNRRTVIRVGIERSVNLHRFFQPYAAVDLAGQFMRLDLREEGGIMGVNQRREIDTKGIGIMPGIGFRTFLGSKICLYAEYRGEFFVNDVDTKTTNYWGNVDTRPTSETEFTMKGGRIFQAGVQVLF